MANRHKVAGKKGGAVRRAKAVAAYNADPNICLHCEKPIKLKSGQKVSAAMLLTFSLSDDTLDELFKSECSYCGRAPSQVAFNSNVCNPAGGGFVYNGLDRIDNAIGYEPGNVCACCYICNRMKHTLSVEEFRTAVAEIARHLRLLD